MKTTITEYLHWYKTEYSDGPRFVLNPQNMSSIGPHYVFIREMDIEVDIPDDFDPVPHQVGALRAKIQEVLAECHIKVANLEEQIQKLLALEDLR